MKINLFKILIGGIVFLCSTIQSSDAFGFRSWVLDEHARTVIEEFGPETYRALGQQVYASNVVFEDPLEKVLGLESVLDYLGQTYTNLAIVETARVKEMARTRNTRIVVWDITYQFQVPVPTPTGDIIVIPLGEPVADEGTSVFHFNEWGQITYHRDYFDLTRLYNNAFDSQALFNQWIQEQLEIILQP